MALNSILLRWRHRSNHPSWLPITDIPPKVVVCLEFWELVLVILDGVEVVYVFQWLRAVFCIGDISRSVVFVVTEF